MTTKSHNAPLACVEEVDPLGPLRQELQRALGPLVCELLADPGVQQVMLNPDGTLWAKHTGHQMEIAGTLPASHADSLIKAVASTLRTPINGLNPIFECELPFSEGSRFEAIIPPVVASPIFSIQKKAARIFSLDDYVDKDMLTEYQRDVIKTAVSSRRNILIAGGTATGKTAFANALIDHMARANPQDRIVIIDNTSELVCSAKNSVLLSTVEHVGMTRLLQATVRLRPDRIVVSGIRDGAALPLLKAWNTDHPGGAATIHAPSACAGLVRLEQLVNESTATPMHPLIAETINLVVAINRTPYFGSRIHEVMYVKGHDGTKYVTELV